MTPAEMKTLREGLGLTHQWLADQLSVQVRTIRYWEAGFYPVKKDVEDLLLSINAKFFNIADNSSEFIKLSNKEAVTLIRYSSDDDLWYFMPDFKPLPATAHASIIFKVLNAAESIGCNVRVVYMDKAAYLEWLGNRQDSESTRALWASEKITES